MEERNYSTMTCDERPSRKEYASISDIIATGEQDLLDARLSRMSPKEKEKFLAKIELAKSTAQQQAIFALQDAIINIRYMPGLANSTKSEVIEYVEAALSIVKPQPIIEDEEQVY